MGVRTPSGTLRQNVVAIQYKVGKPVQAAMLTLEFHQEEGTWLGECLELGTATYASTLEEVRNELFEALSLQLNEVERLGFSDEFCQEHHVQLVPLIQPKGKATEKSAWAVPMLVGG